MEGDAKLTVTRMIWVISTHALTWRATAANLDVGIPVKISTHALTWRATARA